MRLSKDTYVPLGRYLTDIAVEQCQNGGTGRTTLISRLISTEFYFEFVSIAHVHVDHDHDGMDESEDDAAATTTEMLAR